MPLQKETVERIATKTNKLVDSGTRMAITAKQAARVLHEAEQEETQRRIEERERQRRESPISRFFHAIFG